MGDHKDKFYIAKVIEVMKNDQNELTFGLRVRVPTIHGSSTTGVPDDSLPIAKPLPFPGSVLNKGTYESLMGNNAIVYVIFEFGQLDKPRYFGLVSDTTDYTAPDPDLPYATENTKGVIRAKVVGTTGFIYTSD